MAALIFEHPLNEKVRNYLRLEQLFEQLMLSKALQHPLQQQQFFRVLFEVAEVLERCEWRADLLKDLAKQAEKLDQWASMPNVDTSKIEELLLQVKTFIAAIAKHTRVSDHLKNDRLLASIRQRLCLPGGNSSFDLPYLHLWLNQPQALINSQVQQWLSPFQLVAEAIKHLLNLLREQHSDAEVIAHKGFYQGVAAECGLLRIELDTEFQCYPTVSGHKHRFAIKFVSAVNAEVADIPCRLYCCKIA
ncbi:MULTISPECIES: cell division protein ZapD [unclassified Agarivorans]|uniref:cell division protein ZapD n=1 Tax=unclassified Agarivorans TaxID=2636026 RepID=UPI0026E3408B|nr:MULTISPECIES: cell division protein ZapD [unclassified Agarivorans]MDO6686922.1 cell division protein ZapD [Agarivorans sp. 3_MG-2023]MDO6716719.1 cell division protein ZapD [Agarivorans sp. 2_MG-2023]